MKPIKFIHAADIHLDIPLLSVKRVGGSSEERKHEQRTAFKKIFEIARDENVDLVLLSGDIFEHEYVSRGTISFINECFNIVPDTRIYISPGNHDPLLASSFYLSFPWASNVHIFDKQLEEKYIKELDAYIYGTFFDGFYMYDSPIKGFKVKDVSKTNILVTHATLDSMGGAQGYHTISKTDIEKSGFDYVALGHIHKSSPELINGKAFYPGSVVSLGFDETGKHGVIIGTLENKKIEYKFVLIDEREHVNLEIDVNNASSAGEVILKASKIIKDELKEKNYYRIKIYGKVDTTVIEETEYIKREIQKQLSGFMAELFIDCEPDWDLKQIMFGNDLKGLFVRKMTELIEKEKETEEKKKLERALNYGLFAAEGKKVKNI